MTEGDSSAHSGTTPVGTTPEPKVVGSGWTSVVVAHLPAQAAGVERIVVTHAMGFARQVARTVHVMHEGRVAETGPPEQIFENPQQEVTRAFLCEARKQ